VAQPKTMEDKMMPCVEYFSRIINDGFAYVVGDRKKALTTVK
jgi:hypothetical protein